MFKVDDRVRVVTEGKLQGFTGVVKAVDNTALGTFYFVFVDSYSDTHQAREINRMFGFHDRGGDVPFRHSDLQPLDEDRSDVRYFVDNCLDQFGRDCGMVWRLQGNVIEVNCSHGDGGWQPSLYSTSTLDASVGSGLLVEVPASEVHL